MIGARNLLVVLFVVRLLACRLIVGAAPLLVTS